MQTRPSSPATPEPALAGVAIKPAPAGLTVVAMLLCWLALVQCIVVLGWLARWPLLAAAPVMAALAAGAAAWALLRRNQAATAARLALQAGAMALVALLACLLLAGLGYDFSADGQTYHQQAILALAQGWNPLQTPTYPGPHSLWISHYAKGPWIGAASILALSGQIEAGKGLSYLLMLCAGTLAYQVVLVLRPGARRMALLVALLTAFNPVACYQVQSYYVDTQVASLLSIFVLLLFLLARSGAALAGLGLVACCTIGAGLKFPVLPYLVVITAVALALMWVLRQRSTVPMVAKTLAAGCVLALLVNFHPYATNLVSKGHPFYPLAGAGTVDILTGHVSADFLARNRLQKLGLSLFSASEPRMANTLPPGEAQFRLKLPFAVQAEELKAFYRYTDVRVGGFGPLMGGVVLLTLLCTVWGLRGAPPAGPPERVMAALLGGVLVSVLIMPEGWWARYAPQVWFLVVWMAALTAWRAPARGPRILARAALLACACNLALVLLPALANRAVMELDYRAQVASLAEIAARGTPVQMAIKEDSTRHRLSALRVPVTELQAFECPGLADTLIGTNSRLCVPAGAEPLYRRGSAWLASKLGRSL